MTIYHPPTPIIESMNMWKSKADTLIHTRYGKVRVILSVQSLLKDIFDLCISDRSRTSTEIAGEVIRTEIAALEGAERSQTLLNGEKEAVSNNFDLQDLESIEKFHAKLFPQLWAPYNEEFFQESVDRLQKRLQANGLDESYFDGKKCIDLGCGSGRFSIALGLLGAHSVKGIDLGEESLTTAKNWAKSLGLNNVQFEKCSNYNTGQPENYFDFIVSNSVAHHHTRFGEAVHEMHRILAKDGSLWLCLTRSMDNIWGYTSEIIKDVMRLIPVSLTKEVLALCGTPPAAIVTVMDSMYAVYYYRTFEEVQRALLDAGFSRVEQLQFVPEIDLSPDLEDIHRFGNGEIRLIAHK